MIVPALEIYQGRDRLRSRFQVAYSRVIPALNSQVPGLFAPAAPLVVPLEFIVPQNTARETIIRYRAKAGIFVLNTVTATNMQTRCGVVQIDAGTAPGGDPIAVNGNRFAEAIVGDRGMRVVSGNIDTIELRNLWVSLEFPAADLTPNAITTFNPANAVAFISLEVSVESIL